MEPTLQLAAAPDLRRTHRRRDAAIDLAKIDRLPPHSLEAEQGVLGCCLLAPNEAIGLCVEKFKRGPEVFYDLRHQTLFATLVEMRDGAPASAAPIAHSPSPIPQGVPPSPIDLITVRQRLKDRGQLDAIGGVAYLTALVDATPSPANLPFYADIVVEKHLLRRMVQTCSGIVGRIYDEAQQGDVEELLDEVEKEVLGISEEREETASLAMKDLVMQAIGSVEQMVANRGQPTGIASGFADLDQMTTGFHPGEMIVIAARPSMGKTSLAMGIAEHVALDLKQPVGVFSLEMSAESLVLRMLCSRARVNLRDLQGGFLAERAVPKLTNVAGKLAAAPLYIDDTAGLSILQLRAKARRMHQQHGVKLFVIDYLQLLKSTAKRAENRQQEIADISSGLKALAKELRVPVIVLAQLNRELEKREAGAKPRLSDLRESGSIEQDADLVGLLYKPSGKPGSAVEQAIEDEAVCNGDSQPVNLLIAKQRNGPTGDVRLTFLRSLTRFESAPKVDPADIPA